MESAAPRLAPPESGRDLLAELGAPAGDDDLCAHLCQRGGHRGAEVRPAAGDDADLPLHPHQLADVGARRSRWHRGRGGRGGGAAPWAAARACLLLMGSVRRRLAQAWAQVSTQQLQPQAVPCRPAHGFEVD